MDRISTLPTRRTGVVRERAPFAESWEDRTLELPEGRGASWRWLRLFLVSTASYLALTAACTVRSLTLNGGNLVYTLDDPYIHLAMARTWLRAGTIGTTPGDFAFATSSPLWTALLTALAGIVGLRDWLPFAMTVVSCVLLLAIFWWGLSTGPVSGEAAASGTERRVWYLGAALLPVIGHLPGLTLTGMEHPLHAALTVAFLIALMRFVIRPSRLTVMGLYVLAALLPLVRLEGAFAVGAAFLVLALHRRLVHALSILAIGAFPLLALGIYSQASGGFLLANSIVAKAVPSEGPLGWIAKVAANYLSGIQADVALPCIIGIAMVVVCRGLITRSTRTVAPGGFLLTVTVLHLALASVGWFERYQAYLIILGVFLLAWLCRSERFRSLGDARQRGLVAAGAAVGLLLVGFGARQILALRATPQATNNIYQQQFQMGRLVEQQFRDDTVACNDVGVVALRASGPVVDLAGLGSTELLRLTRAVGGSQNLTPGLLTPILERDRTALIMIYEEWFDQDLYGTWYKVADWTVDGSKVVVASKTVAFYTVNPASHEGALRRLRAFESELPAGVRVRYFPLDAPRS